MANGERDRTGVVACAAETVIAVIACSWDWKIGGRTEKHAGPARVKELQHVVLRTFVGGRIP